MAKSPVGGCVDSTTHVPDMGECEGSLQLLMWCGTHSSHPRFLISGTKLNYKKGKKKERGGNERLCLHALRSSPSVQESMGSPQSQTIEPCFLLQRCWSDLKDTLSLQ